MISNASWAPGGVSSGRVDDVPDNGCLKSENSEVLLMLLMLRLLMLTHWLELRPPRLLCGRRGFFSFGGGAPMILKLLISSEGAERGSEALPPPSLNGGGISFSSPRPASPRLKGVAHAAVTADAFFFFTS